MKHIIIEVDGENGDYIAMKDQLIKENSKEAFNKQAYSYDYDIKGRHARAMYPEILNSLSTITYTNFLDLGCGTGEMIKIILTSDKEKRAFGIDISPNMIEVAKKKLPQSVDLRIGDSENLPYSDEFFDVVYCNDSFHHYPNPENVISEVFRVLKKEGIFIICDCWQPYLGRIIMNIYMKHSKEGDVKIYSKREMETMLGTKFKVVTWKTLNNTSCLCIAQKGRRKNG